jgi:hypothetical protein
LHTKYCIRKYTRIIYTEIVVASVLCRLDGGLCYYGSCLLIFSLNLFVIWGCLFVYCSAFALLFRRCLCHRLTPVLSCWTVVLYSHDNSYLSIEYNNLFPWIELTVSINTSSRRKYRKRYIDNFYLPLIKNLHCMREESKLNPGTTYRILHRMLILKRYDYYRRTSW